MNLGQLFGGNKSQSSTAPTQEDGKLRLPPGQYLTTKWPVLSYERTPKFDPDSYRFRVWGEVEQPIELTWSELQALPRTALTADFHCVTTWSRYDNVWEGIAIRDIIAMVRPTAASQFVVAHSWTNYMTNMPYSDFNDEDVMIVFKHDGVEITPDHGGPVRLIVPKLYAYKSAKWLSGLEFLQEDRPGFWELNGYHNHADPWLEERYE